MHYHETDKLAYFTYPDLPIFNFTSSKKDISSDGNLFLYMDHFKIPYPKHCKHEHRDQVVVVKSINDPICDGDALITQEKGLPLMICHADCQAGILYDPKTESLALVHSGWRGSNLNIYGNTIEAMRREFGTNPEDLIAIISPSLGPDHAEFIHHQTELNPSFLRFQCRPNYFNFWTISKHQLEKAGVKTIKIASFCTYSNPDRCFSYRRTKTKQRDATIAML